MPRSKLVRTQGPGSLHQEPELHLLVAGDARVGCPTLPVLPQEILDDLGPELLFEVLDVVRYAKYPAHSPGVGRVLGGAAPLVLPAVRSRLRCRKPHGNAYDVVARILQKVCRHRGVDSPAHGQQLLRRFSSLYIVSPVKLHSRISRSSRIAAIAPLDPSLTRACPMLQLGITNPQEASLEPLEQARKITEIASERQGSDILLLDVSKGLQFRRLLCDNELPHPPSHSGPARRDRVRPEGHKRRPYSQRGLSKFRMGPARLRKRGRTHLLRLRA